MNAQQLKKSILQYAMQGKLVAQDPNDGYAAELVEQIRIEKDQLIQKKVIKKDKALQPISDKEIPFDIPENWKWIRLSEIFRIINGDRGKNYPSKAKLTTEGIPFISAANIEKGTISKEKLLYMNQEQYDKLSGGKLIEGDMVLCIRGSLGKSGRFPFKTGAIASSLVILRSYIDENILYEYLNVYFGSSIFNSEIRLYNNGTAQPNLSAKDLAMFRIPLPPLDEQIRIVNKVEDLFGVVHKYELNSIEINNLQDLFPAKLENSILHYAMQGKLVEQNPNDEPAAELIKHIREEKERLIEEKIIKKEKALPPIGDEEIPFDIPDTWEWVRVSEICRVNPKNRLEDEKEAAFIPMKLIEDGLKNSHSYELRKWREIKKGYTHFQTGDIVIAKITPCFENLKSAIIKDLPNNTGAGTTELFVLRPYLSNIDKNYLLWIFKSSYFIKGGISSFSGTAGQQRVSRTFLENLVIPLPPLNEQKRIVEKINNFRNKIQKL